MTDERKNGAIDLSDREQKVFRLGVLAEAIGRQRQALAALESEQRAIFAELAGGGEPVAAPGAGIEEVRAGEPVAAAGD